MGDDGLAFTDYQVLIEEGFERMLPFVYVLPINKLVGWFCAEENFDLLSLVEEPSIDTTELWNVDTNSWNFTHVCGIANSSEDGACVILLVDLLQQQLTLHHVCFEQDADEDVDSMLAQSELFESVKHGFLCWMDNKYAGYNLEASSFVPQRTEFPLSLSIGVLLKHFGFYLGVDFNNLSETVLEALAFSLPQTPVVTLHRQTPLELSGAKTAAILVQGSSFEINEEVEGRVTLFLHSQGSKRITWMDSFNLTLFFLSEPATMLEIATLAGLLGLLPGVRRGTLLNPKKDTARLNKAGIMYNAMYADSNSVKQYGSSSTKIQRKMRKDKEIKRPARFSQRRVRDGRLPRIVQTAVPRAVRGTGAHCDEWCLFALSPLGRQEAAERLQIVAPKYDAPDATLTNPNLLIKKLLAENAGELSRAELERLWMEQKPKSVRDHYQQSVLSDSIKNWLRGFVRWNIPPLLISEVRNGVTYYQLNPNTTAPLDPIVEEPEVPLDGHSQYILDQFARVKILQVQDLLTLIAIDTSAPTVMDLVEKSFQTLVDRQLLYCLNSERFEFVKRFYIHSSGRPSFEEFYAAVNDHLRSDFMIQNGMEISRTLAHIAYHGNCIGDVPGLFSQYMISDMDSKAVSVEFCQEYPEMGNGLFAKILLPKGTLFPVTGLTQVASQKDQRFLSYGFAYINDKHRRIEIDTKPDDQVTCLAGFVNDPKGTLLQANADQVLCRREERLYLVLTRDVNAGEQILWNYGPEYWQQHDNWTAPMPLPTMPMPGLVRYTPLTINSQTPLFFGDTVYATGDFPLSSQWDSF